MVFVNLGREDMLLAEGDADYEQYVLPSASTHTSTISILCMGNRQRCIHFLANDNRSICRPPSTRIPTKTHSSDMALPWRDLVDAPEPIGPSPVAESELSSFCPS